MALSILRPRVYLFQGISSPLHFTGQGNLAMLRDNRLIEEDMIGWLLTKVNEVFMEPDDGMGLDRFQFEQGDEVTFEVLSAAIRDRLNVLETRVEVVDVALREGEAGVDDTKMIVLIIYKIPALVQEDENLFTLEVATGGN